MTNDNPSLTELVGAVRRLIDITVSVDAPPDVLRAAAGRLDELTAALAAHVPDPPPARYFGGGTPAEIFAYDYVMGRWNPLAAPLRIEWQEPTSIATATFGRAYEGPPGCVHGAAIAAAFDQVLNVANLMSGSAGPTARLTVNYRRPTPLHRELRFEGWVERREERKVHSRGRLLVDGTVTVEAEALYIVVAADQVMRLLER
jgi:acyl-coenzyme A thioesterase PaaI-like protein